jgi:hypothetical protein
MSHFPFLKILLFKIHFLQNGSPWIQLLMSTELEQRDKHANLTPTERFTSDVGSQLLTAS